METKNGELFDGILDKIDYYMNIKLKEVTVTNLATKKQRNCDEAFLKGNGIKGIKLEKDFIESYKQELERKSKLFIIMIK